MALGAPNAGGDKPWYQCQNPNDYVKKADNGGEFSVELAKDWAVLKYTEAFPEDRIMPNSRGKIVTNKNDGKNYACFPANIEGEYFVLSGKKWVLIDEEEVKKTFPSLVGETTAAPGENSTVSLPAAAHIPRPDASSSEAPARAAAAPSPRSFVERHRLAIAAVLAGLIIATFVKTRRNPHGHDEVVAANSSSSTPDLDKLPFQAPLEGLDRSLRGMSEALGDLQSAMTEAERIRKDAAELMKGGTASASTQTVADVAPRKSSETPVTAPSQRSGSQTTEELRNFFGQEKDLKYLESQLDRIAESVTEWILSSTASSGAFQEEMTREAGGLGKRENLKPAEMVKIRWFLICKIAEKLSASEESDKRAFDEERLAQLRTDPATGIIGLPPGRGNLRAGDFFGITTDGELRIFTRDSSGKMVDVTATFYHTTEDKEPGKGMIAIKNAPAATGSRAVPPLPEPPPSASRPAEAVAPIASSTTAPATTVAVGSASKVPAEAPKNAVSGVFGGIRIMEGFLDDLRKAAGDFPPEASPAPVASNVPAALTTAVTPKAAKAQEAKVATPAVKEPARDEGMEYAKEMAAFIAKGEDRNNDEDLADWIRRLFIYTRGLEDKRLEPAFIDYLSKHGSARVKKAVLTLTSGATVAPVDTAAKGAGAPKDLPGVSPEKERALKTVHAWAKLYAKQIRDPERRKQRKLWDKKWEKDLGEFLGQDGVRGDDIPGLLKAFSAEVDKELEK